MKSKVINALSNSRTLALSSVLAALSITLTIPAAHASAQQCQSIFIPIERILIPEADLAVQAEAQYDSWNVKAYREIENLKTRVPSLAGSRKLLNGLKQVLKDERLSSYHQLIETAARAAQISDASTYPSVNGRDLLVSHIRAEVAKFLGEDVATARVALLKSAKLDKETVLRALGKVTVDEARTNLIGANGIHDVAPDSLIGKYLAKAAALGRPAETFVGRFFTGPNSRTRGGERLYVSVDPTTAPLAEEMFGKNPHFLIHNHNPGQGTLYLQHNGKAVSYAKYDYDSSISTSRGTLAPIMPLSSLEASNTMNLFELGRLTSSSRTKYPSSLVDMRSGEAKMYMRPGAYTCCTHWFGEMALGEKLVDTYSVPGTADQHGRTQDPLAKNQRAVRTAPVGTYTHFNYHGTPNKVGYKTREDRLTRLVWQQGKGSEQMWSMLDAMPQLSRAELTNPGWVLYTLISTGKADRAPVVLVYRDNASEPLNQATLDALRNDSNIPHY